MKIQFQVQLPNGEKHKGVVEEFDSYSDLALIRINCVSTYLYLKTSNSYTGDSQLSKVQLIKMCKSLPVRRPL